MVRFDFPIYIGCECKDRGPIIKCHDSGITLALHLKTPVKASEWRTVYEDYRIPDGTTAVIRIKKPDNTVVLTDTGITFDGSSVVVCSDLEQAFTAPGICTAELSLYNPDGKRLTSATFTYEVESECVCDEDKRSDDYIDILGGRVKEVNEAAASAEESAKIAEESATAASTFAAEAEGWAKKAEEFANSSGTGGTGGSGKDGEDGVGIKSIERTSGDGSAGTTDTYTITFTDETTSTFTVYNGKDGEGGSGAGETGADGITPHIGDNGNWYIGEEDTGVKAVGEDGTNGADGITPHVGDNGNWFLGTTDTGVNARGLNDTQLRLVTLTVADWDENLTQTVHVDGIVEDDLKQVIDIVPTDESKVAFSTCRIECSACGVDSLVFKTSVVPQTDVTVYVVVSNTSDELMRDVYSTAETVVGRWIDGKPVYRKVALCSVALPGGSVPNGGGWVTIDDLSALSIDEVVNYSLHLDCLSVYGDVRMSTFIHSSVTSAGLLRANSMLAKSVTVSRYTIEYTKTTDEATVSTTALMESYDEGVNEA